MRWGTSKQKTQSLWSGGKGLVWGNYAALTQRQMGWEGDWEEVDVSNKAKTGLMQEISYKND